MKICVFIGIFFFLFFHHWVPLANTDQGGSKELELGELIQETIRVNPEIKQAYAVWQATLAVPKRVSTLPNPEIMFGLKNVGSKYSVGTEPMSMLEFGITQPLPYAKKLSLLGKAAKQHAYAKGEEYRTTFLNIIARLKSAYFDYYYIEKLMISLNKTLEILKKLEEASLVRYQVGAGIQQDVLKAQLEISRLVERLLALKQNKGTIQAKINSILNKPPDAPLGKPVDFKPTDFDYTPDTLIKMAKRQSPELKKIKHIVEREAYNLRLYKNGLCSRLFSKS